MLEMITENMDLSGIEKCSTHFQGNHSGGLTGLTKAILLWLVELQVAQENTCRDEFIFSPLNMPQQDLKNVR
jgi:hypothetical protein